IPPPSIGAGNRRQSQSVMPENYRISGHSYAADDLDRGGAGGCHPPSHHPKLFLHLIG
ncbi:hypothetical protein A2U01_0088794, partial [Trifolium medium]|nr:hypothetical protein [Trifolium medium]